MMRHGWFGVSCVAMLISLGCEKSPAPPKPSEKPAEKAVVSTPTTQELMSGPYKRVLLSPLPFYARVPQSWENKMMEGTTLNFLQGSGPDGQDVQISLVIGTPVKSESLKNVLARAQRDADKDKNTYREFHIRQIGDIQVMEEQKLFTSTDNPREQLIDWKMTFFVPRDLDYAPYVVDVLGMTTERFEKSKDLLKKISDSIEYERS